MLVMFLRNYQQDTPPLLSCHTPDLTITLRCVGGALSGAFHGAGDGLSFIAAPWARLFQPMLGSGTKKPALKDSSSQTQPSLESLIQPEENEGVSLDGRCSTNSLSSEVTERETFIPINSSHSTSTLGQCSPRDTSEQNVVTSKLNADNSRPEEDSLYSVLAEFYQLC